ncbi:MAG: TetR/AcrR family transcriptional regulator [Acidimicrobiales bacterium]
MGGSTRSRSSRRRLSPAERRAELLDALAAELAETDFHQVAVPAVVRRAGASQGLFYRYFDDLDAAFVELLEDRVVPRLREATESLHLDHERGVDVEVDLAAWFEVLAALVEDDGPVLRAALQAAPTASGAAGDYCRALIEGFRQWGEDLLREVEGRPPFRRIDPHQVSHMVIGMTLHCVFNGLEGVEPSRWARELAGFEAWGLLARPDDDDEAASR